MRFNIRSFILVMTTGLLMAAPADLALMRAEAGGGPAGHGHGKAGDGQGNKDDHGKEEKSHGGSPVMGRMKMGGHGDDGHRDDGGGHGGGAIKGLSKFEAKGFQLLSDLHCNACHYIGPELSHGGAMGGGHGGGHGSVAPNLTYMGDKFRAGWLYDFLRKPNTIRPWLKIRMPDFRLSEFEAVALTKHLIADHRDRRLPAPKLAAENGKAGKDTFLQAGKKLMSKEFFDCWSCHQQGEKKPDTPKEEWAPDLLIASRRLKPEWVVRWVSDPQKLIPGTKMPTFFEDAESGPDEILGGDEKKQIAAITGYLFSLNANKSGSSSFERAAKRYTRATRTLGAQLMSELNCAGCHDAGVEHERLEAGPPLAHEGSRVNKKWLVNYLRKPSRIRQMGYRSGAASRMPDFRLSDKEANAIASFLMTRTDKRMHVDEKPHAVNKEKAGRGARLFVSLRCGSCHPAKAASGPKRTTRFAGPNLARAGGRLQEEHLRLWLAGDVPKTGSRMEMDSHPLIPKMGLTKKQIEELTAYVVTLK